MKIKEIPNAPAWLVKAETLDADVTVQDGRVVWRGGLWLGGEWRGGLWRGGEWCGGEWCEGQWCGGQWHDGVWRDGLWLGGEWCDGQWCGGEWCGGEWHGGLWLDEKTQRLEFMAAACGIVFGADGWATAYRTTTLDGHGRYTKCFVQPEGEYYEDNLPPPGSGTCVRGIHVSTAATAHTLLGVDHSAQMWEVRFKRSDLLDCDGQKARISGGVFRKIARPF